MFVEGKTVYERTHTQTHTSKGGKKMTNWDLMKVRSEYVYIDIASQWNEYILV